MCEICSKLTIKTPQRRQWRLSDVFIINFEQISHIVVVFPLFPLNKDIDMFEEIAPSQKPNFNKLPNMKVTVY